MEDDVKEVSFRDNLGRRSGLERRQDGNESVSIERRQAPERRRSAGDRRTGGDRRDGIERRQKFQGIEIEDRRSGSDRRSNIDRRAFLIGNF